MTGPSTAADQKREGTVGALGQTGCASHPRAARDDRDGLSPLRTDETPRLHGDNQGGTVELFRP